MVHWCGCAGLVGLVGTSYFSELLFEMFLSNVSVTNSVALALNSQETQRGLPCTRSTWYLLGEVELLF